jgi:O-methyltransferase domain/Dimerisation domain
VEETALRPSLALRRLVNGYQVSQAIHVAATLGIADLLISGPKSSDELAAESGANPDALYRLLRALAAVGVFHEDDDRRFSLTDLGEYLRSDAPEPVAGWAAFIGQPSYWQVWGDLFNSVKTGENAFRHVHGVDVWTYRSKHPEVSAAFDRSQTDLSQLEAVEVVSAYDFGRFAKIADIAGGRGAFLAAILKRWPQSNGVLFDQPHVVSGARDTFAAAGVSDRVDIVAGDFFKSVPAADAYVLKKILHDWEDAENISILANCKAASPQASILLVEVIIGPPNQTPDAKFSDLNMLVSPGGRERTVAEYSALFAASGYRFNGVTPSAGGYGVFEGVPA